MKVKILKDTLIVAKSGQVVEVDEKTYKTLLNKNIATAIEPEKVEIKEAPEREVKVAKKQTRKVK